MHNVANKEEFEGNTEALATAAYIKIREDVSTGLTYKFTLRRKLYKKFN
ncbi:MAG: palindromic element RPE1 domain-containing protein [Rickettsia conorii subsp. raoultii]|uniref:Palindromic element RPE1 domain-containing protein n=1 Tax=Rickettsia conorii subsp. raoultii TaxID=369822 RepID=A0ABY4TYT4_RICCR|nr:palindromic element RPE1 domain-containing protein [Rickettsia conorii]APZ30171.1 ribose-phosphate pyrophosphokinase [Rickettsia conorii subsp. raoultii]URW77564.1 palindromic element RPE1 domain-containing protein [Rickettsia conorii subsp. raoultii]